MATSSQTYTSVEGYAFHLRADLRTAANEGLAPLRNTMEEMGYSWLDGYLEGVIGSSSRAPITELMKTPSRTATTKKTRATTAAAKDRTEKVKGLNTRLALLSPSPSKGSPGARQPFSPLQPRSLNAPLPPQPIFSPSPLKSQAAKGKGKEKEKEKGKSKATKGKKGKGKKVDEVSVGILSPPSKTSSRSKQSAQITEVESLPTGRSISRTEAEAPDEANVLVKQPSKADSAVDDDLKENQARRPPVSNKASQGKPPSTENKTSERRGKDLSDAPAAQSPLEPSTQGSTGNLDAAETPSPITTFELAPAVATTSAHPVRVPDLSMIAEESSRIDSASTSMEPLAVTRSVVVEGKNAEQVTIPGSAVPQPIQSAPPPPAPAPKVPVRQVRSSWLSKALGTDTVPVSHTSDLRKSFAAGAELRKSFAPVNDNRKSFAASSIRPNTPVDLTAARKSIAPVNVLKRKSEIGMEEEILHIERPEKVARFDETIQQAVVTPQNEVHYDFPIALASSPRATASEHSRGERGRSDIHKVSRALDELRERAQAKEAAAKAKAAAIAHAQKVAMYEPKAQSTGSGFLRGLGNSLGRSLGFGAARSAEEEARQREEEELAEQQAKEELERLMAGSPTSVREHAVQEMGRSTSPLGQPSRDQPRSELPVLPVDLVAQLDEDEVMDESEVIDELDDDETEERAPLITAADSKIRSTTPTGTPPRVPAAVAAAPPLHSRNEKHMHGEAAKVPKIMPEDEAPASQRTEAAQLIRPPPVLVQDKPIVQENSRWAGAGLDMEEDELDEDEEEEERIEELPRKHEHRDNQAKFSMAPTSLSASTSSQSTSVGFFGHASTMANKALGVKASAGPVKSIQLAAAAAKKEQEAAERKAYLKEQAEQRRIEAARKKAEEDRIKAEEERRVKAAEAEERRARQAEIDEKRRQRLEAEKKRREKEDRIAKEKAAKEAEERAVAKAKAEEEANKKRKLAPQLNKSANATAMHPAKRVGAPSGPMAVIKPKEPFRPTKGPNALASSTASKMGPTAFRTATTVSIETNITQTSTISLVQQPQGERRPLGPPSRASHQPMVPTNTIRPVQTAPTGPNTNGNPQPAAVLQAQRLALKTQIDEVQSEDIVLPDIASEYSNSDDESNASPDFKRPAWAESPALRAALEAQATRNPDDLFGEIKPVSMEELFKVRQGKFRARTSSANWGGGDRLTRMEEVEYARRMGFNKGEGSGTAQ